MAPKPRPAKRKSDCISDDFVADNGDSPAPDTKRSKPAGSALSDGNAKIDKEGNQYWEISKTRRVALSEFKGQRMVSIREYYEKDSDWLPGKKGISMTLEQYSTFINLLPQLEDALSKKGDSVPRPQYDQQAASKSEDDAVKPRKQKSNKSNFEATSDEEEDED